MASAVIPKFQTSTAIPVARPRSGGSGRTTAAPDGAVRHAVLPARRRRPALLGSKANAEPSIACTWLALSIADPVHAWHDAACVRSIFLSGSTPTISSTRAPCVVLAIAKLANLMEVKEAAAELV